MDRGIWWATVHEVARVRYNLVTKPPTYLIKDRFPEYIKNSENSLIRKQTTQLLKNKTGK